MNLVDAIIQVVGNQPNTQCIVAISGPAYAALLLTELLKPKLSKDVTVIRVSHSHDLFTADVKVFIDPDGTWEIADRYSPRLEGKLGE